MENLKVEYLAIVNSKEGFCNSISAFNNLLQSYSSIEIKAKGLVFDGVKFDYDVQQGEIQNNSHIFFHVRLGCQNKTEIAVFLSLLKSIRTILAKAAERPVEVLWDDISSSLSTAAYPVIHEIENMMRKLITKFMLTKIGLGWTKEAVPREVSESIKTKKNATGNNYLFETDFIQLSDFLFKPYSTASSSKLMEKVRSAVSASEINIDELKELVPTSNWERYFQPIVSCKSEYLQTRWAKLYELRCLVAHNNFIGHDDFEHILKISGEVKDKLSEALTKLDSIYMSPEQKEEVAENIATTVNSTHAELIAIWISIQQLLIEIAMNALHHEQARKLIKNKTSTRLIVDKLVDEGIITSTLAQELVKLQLSRDIIVHNVDAELNGSVLNTADRIKHDLIETLESFDKTSSLPLTDSLPEINDLDG
ncbi:HEPN domain-containing protein [Pseudomonas sp. 37 R 15]|uniref:HEPN domain-containing protein n=1 Tax=Pseudomonas sp. 37 R 15 TaxID=1844104 RepID=UPI00081C068D|nr:HEPN domain-containing protein [Pseudomonas sp. 37 R 15]